MSRGGRHASFVQRFCEEDGCAEPYSAKGLCKTHYNRAHRIAHLDERKEKDRAYHAAHRETKNRYDREYRSANLDRLQAYDRARYHDGSHREDRASNRERGRRYYAANTEKERARNRRYRAERPDMIHKNSMTGAARRRPTRHGGFVGVLPLYLGDDPRCDICGAPDPLSRKGWQIDHHHDHCPGLEGCPACIRAVVCVRCNVLEGTIRRGLQSGLIDAAPSGPIAVLFGPIEDCPIQRWTLEALPAFLDILDEFGSIPATDDARWLRYKPEVPAAMDFVRRWWPLVNERYA